MAGMRIVAMDMTEIQKKVEKWNDLLSPLEGLIDQQAERIRHEMNRLVYETAEKLGMSVWQVVAHYYPKVEHCDPEMKKVGDCVNVTMETIVRLKPYSLQIVPEEDGCGHSCGCV